mmetsp:Transcript_112875/g.319292  ORF Transcript_112875/g.319292 Transcript_112875/m.319292 type:complete len:235 (+) Transcript_112875:458-1162(+)
MGLPLRCFSAGGVLLPLGITGCSASGARGVGTTEVSCALGVCSTISPGELYRSTAVLNCFANVGYLCITRSNSTRGRTSNSARVRAAQEAWRQFTSSRRESSPKVSACLACSSILPPPSAHSPCSLMSSHRSIRDSSSTAPGSYSSTSPLETKYIASPGAPFLKSNSFGTRITQLRESKPTSETMHSEGQPVKMLQLLMNFLWMERSSLRRSETDSSSKMPLSMCEQTEAFKYL